MGNGDRQGVSESRMVRLMMLMPHFGSAGVGALCDEWNPQDLVTVIAGDFQGILIDIINFFFFFPKQLATFRAFANEHGHRYRSV